MVKKVLVPLCLLLALAPARMRGQFPKREESRISVYGLFSETYIDGSANGSFDVSRFFPSGTAGVLIALNHDVVGVSLDLRGSFHPGTPGFDTALAGVRVAPNRHKRITPYGQISAGYLYTSGNQTTLNFNGFTLESTPGGAGYFAIEFLAGLDYHLSRRLDYRLVEAGFGFAFNGQPIGSVDGGGSGQGAGLVPLSTGVVFHF